MYKRTRDSFCPFPLIFLLLFVGTFQHLDAEPYRPYPIIFIHGLNGGAWHWGVNLTNEEWRKLKEGKGGGDFPYVEPWRIIEDHMVDKMYPLMEPYRIGLYNRLAAISLDDPAGSVDPGPYNTSATIKYHFSRIVNGDTIPDSISVTLRDRGAGYELQHFIKQVLFTYYDTTWNLNPDAKVVLVAHSMGGVVIAEALRQDPSLKPHIHKVITLAAPLKGAWVLDPFACYVRIPVTLKGGITA